MDAATKKMLGTLIRDQHQRHAGPAGLAVELVRGARNPVDRLERAEHGLRALEGVSKYREAIALTRAAAEVTGTTPSRARMLAAGLEAMSLSTAPPLVAYSLYQACPRGQSTVLAERLLELTETPHEELAQAVLSSPSLSEASKREMFSRFLDQVTPRDDFRGFAHGAEALVSGVLGPLARVEAAQLALRETAQAAPDEEQRSLCQLGLDLAAEVSPTLASRYASAILGDLAWGHKSRHNEALVEDLVAKGTGPERQATQRLTAEWLASHA